MASTIDTSSKFAYLVECPITGQSASTGPVGPARLTWNAADSDRSKPSPLSVRNVSADVFASGSVRSRSPASALQLPSQPAKRPFQSHSFNDGYTPSAKAPIPSCPAPTHSLQPPTFSVTESDSLVLLALLGHELLAEERTDDQWQRLLRNTMQAAVCQPALSASGKRKVVSLLTSKEAQTAHARLEQVCKQASQAIHLGETPAASAEPTDAAAAAPTMALPLPKPIPVAQPPHEAAAVSPQPLKFPPLRLLSEATMASMFGKSSSGTAATKDLLNDTFQQQQQQQQHLQQQQQLQQPSTGLHPHGNWDVILSSTTTPTSLTVDSSANNNEPATVVADEGSSALSAAVSSTPTPTRNIIKQMMVKQLVLEHSTNPLLLQQAAESYTRSSGDTEPANIVNRNFRNHCLAVASSTILQATLESAQSLSKDLWDAAYDRAMKNLFDKYKAAKNHLTKRTFKAVEADVLAGRKQLVSFADVCNAGSTDVRNWERLWAALVQLDTRADRRFSSLAAAVRKAQRLYAQYTAQEANLLRNAQNDFGAQGETDDDSSDEETSDEDVVGLGAAVPKAAEPLVLAETMIEKPEAAAEPAGLLPATGSGSFLEKAFHASAAAAEHQQEQAGSVEVLPLAKPVGSAQPSKKVHKKKPAVRMPPASDDEAEDYGLWSPEPPGK